MWSVATVWKPDIILACSADGFVENSMMQFRVGMCAMSFNHMEYMMLMFIATYMYLG